MKIVVNNIKISIDKNQDKEIKKELAKKGFPEKLISKVEYLKRSIDSRKKGQIFFIYNLELTLNKRIDLEKNKWASKVKEIVHVKREPKKVDSQIVIIGTGPAGLFAGLRACEYGFKPLIIERGEKVEDRDKSVDNFYNTSILNEDSNIQFGEGGAGTYSDGKLTTRIRSEYIDKVFRELVDNGAQEQILWDYKPHVGTDILKIVVKNLREKIISLGGKFMFKTKLVDIRIENEEIKEIEVETSTGREKIETNHLFLGIGHSARDTYRMLNRRGVFLESKPFAVGARIEHPRVDIDKMQFGKLYNHPNLESANYNMTYNNREEKRGIFSFCMCPGGVIVNASSEKGKTLVNGMSYSDRAGEFSNSAIAVAVRQEDFGNDIFSGMEFQEKLEKKTYEMIGNYGGAYQSVLDFIDNKKTKHEIASSYPMRLESTNLNELFPDVIKDNMKMAFDYWKRRPNFISERANLIGPETRTSAPVKITRNENGESINTKGLYPIGEGAGYAGGITSAAVDGIKIVDLALTKKDY